MKRQASARWTGNFQQGQGEISTQSGVLKSSPYTFGTRFENNAGTNPEELIAAAHASCFTMALAAELGKKGLTPELLETTAEVNIEKIAQGFAIDTSHLHLKARVAGIDERDFNQIAEAAKTHCPVSKVLKAKISLETEFLPGEQSAQSPSL